MNINEAILVEKDFLLCEVDQALAHAFLQDAVRAVKNAHDEDTRELQSAVIKSMLVFHRHR
jgi:hypothetical protein